MEWASRPCQETRAGLNMLRSFISFGCLALLITAATWFLTFFGSNDYEHMSAWHKPWALIATPSWWLVTVINSPRPIYDLPNPINWFYPITALIIVNFVIGGLVGIAVYFSKSRFR